MSTLSLRKIKHDSSSVDNITLDSSGNVGVNKTTPRATGGFNSLSLNGTDGSEIWFDAGNTAATRLSGTASETRITAQASGSVITMFTGATERLRVDGSGRVTMPYQPIFHAAQRTSNSSGVILSFQLTYVNVGSHFNGTRFTCPIAGKYKFYYASLFGGISTVGRFWLYKNGSHAYAENSGDGVQLRIDNSDGHGYPYGERTIIVSANAGDYFEIYYSCDNGGTNGGSAGYTTFGGELVS